MSPEASLALQYLIVAVAVAVSAWVVFRKQAPNAARRLRIALALPLVRDGQPAWMRTLGKWIAPAVASTTEACGGCNGCDSRSAQRP